MSDRDFRDTHVERLQQRQQAVRGLAVAAPYFAERALTTPTEIARHYMRAMRLCIRELIMHRDAIAISCQGWFDPVEPGPYAVQAFGPAGAEYDAPHGFHYPYQALAAEQDFRADHPDLITRTANTDDPEASVEADEEAYFVEEVAA